MPQNKTMAKRRTGSVTCAYCQGDGIDPFGIPSVLSTCQVCGGRGKVLVAKPTTKCVFCDGSLVFPGRRLTCTACMGKGVVKAVQNPDSCPDCEGSGESTSTPGLPCVRCQGKGVIEG